MWGDYLTSQRVGLSFGMLRFNHEPHVVDMLNDVVYREQRGKPAYHLYLMISVKKCDENNYQFTLESERLTNIFHYPSAEIFKQLSQKTPESTVEETVLADGAAIKYKDKYAPVTVTKAQLDNLCTYLRKHEIFLRASIDKFLTVEFTNQFEKGLKQLTPEPEKKSLLTP